MCLLTHLPAQSNPDGFTFHVWVDPMFGDDRVATEANPSLSSFQLSWGLVDSRKPLSTPANFPPAFPWPGDPNIVGYLQHAPFPFRTVENAIAYCVMLFPGSTLQALAPWTNPETGKRVEHVIIHCLPGLYGPVDEPRSLLPIDPESGLRFNGEDFPIVLPTGLSLQGTSALDTIFDARLQQTAILVVDQGQSAHVDGLCLRRARGGGPMWNPGGGPNMNGAAISIAGEWNAKLTVSNCFLIDNTVGIGIHSDATIPDPHSPLIVNNTFFDNKIGIWNGNKHPSQPNIGLAEPRLINNIIDPGVETHAAMWGVHDGDLRVIQAAVRPGTSPPALPPTGLDFNAYPTDTVNQGGQTPPETSNWLVDPGTLMLRMAPSPLGYTPRVDLDPFIARVSPTAPRGVLYVADALRSGVGVHLSPHDLRLSPNTSDAGTYTELPDVSPLIDMGISLENHTSLVIQNRPGLPITWPPGPGTPGGETIQGAAVVSYHAWDWDAEGFGNPRIRELATFQPPAGMDVYSHIDLGADEMGELIISGYVPWTRLCSFQPSGATYPAGDQLRVFFHNFRDLDQTQVLAEYERPRYNVAIGDGYTWWEHVRDTPEAAPAGLVSPDCCVVWFQNGQTLGVSNYTQTTNYAGFVAGAQRTLREWHVRHPAHVGQTYLGNPAPVSIPISVLPSFYSSPPISEFDWQEPVPRNLACDFSGYLLLDPHPQWGAIMNTTAPLFPGDAYAANPWYGSPLQWRFQDGNFQEGLADNWFLYSSLSCTTGLPPNCDWVTGVIEGHINPPGTARPVLGDPPVSGALPVWLTQPLSVNTFPPFTSCNTDDRYRIGSFGFGDLHPWAPSQCPDVIPSVLDQVGIRFNCQVLPTDSPASSNLQTMLTVVMFPPPMLSGSSWSTRRIELPELSAPRDVRSILRSSPLRTRR